MTELRPHWSSRTKLTVILLLLAAGVYLLFRFSVVLTPLILAIIFAYVLTPLVNMLQARFRLTRTLAVAVTYLLVLTSLTIIPVLVIPPLVEQTAGLNVGAQRFLMAVENLLGHKYLIAGQVVDVDALFQRLIGSMQNLLEPVFGQTLTLAADILGAVVWAIFITVVSFYLVKDGPRLRVWWEEIVPPTYRQDYIRLRDEINQIWSAFFRGQLVLATVVAVLITVIGFILGLPFALAMGVLAGLMEFFPSLGHGIWLTIAALLALFGGSTWLPLPNWAFTLLVIGLHLVYQQFDLNYLIPRIIGRSVHLPPLVVILGIVTGAVLAGVLGILLAAPAIASGRVLARYVYANLFDLEPFPGSAAPLLPPPDPRWWRNLSPRKQVSTEDKS